MPKTTHFSLLLSLLFLFSACVYGQDVRSAITQKLISEYALTQPTADNSDIVTAGAVLVLKRGNIMTVPVSNSNLYQNTYRNGRISQNTLGKADKWLHAMPGQSINTDIRTFVPGEKLWVTGIQVREDGIVFDLFTDAYSDIRYKASLKFWFPKNSIPSVEEADKLVAQVFQVQPADNSAQQQPQPPAAGVQATPASYRPAAAPPPAPAAPEEQAPPPIAPPPPPADQAPATIDKGATPDQVVAALGPPVKQVTLGTKMIYIYKDLKVTFVNKKVTDVQ